jgi:hypothetical protein
MSRWADAFAALSGAADTLDTMRHSETPIPTVSLSVNSVIATTPPWALGEPTISEPRKRASVIWGETEEERAAIVAEGAGVPREWAEGFARLVPDRPPCDVQFARWRRFVDDVGLFLDSPFCSVAAAFGWGPYDLFGCNRDRPFARIDQAGLLWLLNGRKLVALSEDAAVIESRGGVRTTYRLDANTRASVPAGRTLAWELAPND